MSGEEACGLDDDLAHHLASGYDLADLPSPFARQQHHLLWIFVRTRPLALAANLLNSCTQFILTPDPALREVVLDCAYLHARPRIAPEDVEDWAGHRSAWLGVENSLLVRRQIPF
jgi:hypothetical protein